MPAGGAIGGAVWTTIAKISFWGGIVYKSLVVAILGSKSRRPRRSERGFRLKDSSVRTNCSQKSCFNDSWVHFASSALETGLTFHKFRCNGSKVGRVGVLINDRLGAPKALQTVRADFQPSSLGA